VDKNWIKFDIVPLLAMTEFNLRFLSLSQQLFHPPSQRGQPSSKGS